MSFTVPHLAPAGLAAVALLALAACGGGSPNAAIDPGAGPQTQQYGGGDDRQPPGAFGTIAAISGRTLQVQNKVTGQVAVTYTATTSISAEVKASLKDAKVGSCVVVTSADSAPSQSAGSPITASAVRIHPKTNGTCGLRGPGGPGGGQGQRKFRPSGAPSTRPTDLPGDGARRIAFGLSGEVTALTSHGFTVAATRPPADGSSASPTTSPVSVVVTDDTTYTTTRKATPTALKVGRCLQASGRTDDTGAVTATSLTVSDPVDGQCSGFMMGGPR